MTANIEKICSGDKRELARAITLIESQRPEHRQEAESLVSTLLPHSGNSIRVGITGVPGVGKSTFIEALGTKLIENKNKLAVLAVDPTSPMSGGSILGDKTRMEQLSRQDNAFIRPSPTSGHLGGVAQNTREAIILCEAAGYDTILVETVGVGQSEHEVASMVDFFMLLTLPNSGDELQGIKKGILELTHAILVNKADGDSIEMAEVSKEQLKGGLSLIKPATDFWNTSVITCSALEGTHINQVAKTIKDFCKISKENDYFTKNRADQQKDWFEKLVQQMWINSLLSDPQRSALKHKLTKKVMDGKETPLSAARRLLE